MDDARIAQALESYIGKDLAAELAADFIKIRQDYATKTLERASCGKFVETFVQCLQYIATGSFDATPAVEDYLVKRVENETGLPDGLRICAARVARSIYALRSHRNIAHKKPIDPNTYDLALIHQGAAWISAELLRNATGVSMQEAGALIELLQTPVGTLVEEIDGIRLVHANVSADTELLILLHSHYPEHLPLGEIYKCMYTVKESTIRGSISRMRTKKLLSGDGKTKGYRLTQAGYAAAVKEINKLKI